MASSTNNSSKLDFLNNILYGAIGIFIILIFVYFIFIFGLTEEQKGTWGTFGDFIGGTLNPIFALFSLFAIIYTIKIQTHELELSRKELKATKEELEKSRIAQEEQSKTLQLQNEATNLQMFETTFFQLLNQHNEYLDLVLKDNITIDYFEYSPNEFGEPIKCGLKTTDKIFTLFCSLNQQKRTLKNYFMTLFQIFKYINKYKKRNYINAKFYTNLIRALVDDDILRLLAINCIAYPFGEYKKYIEEYAFFEHIYLDEKKEETESILKILAHYESSAFDKNFVLNLMVDKYR